MSRKVDLIELNQSISLKTFGVGTGRKVYQYQKQLKGFAVGADSSSLDFFIRNQQQCANKEILYSVNTVDNLSKKCKNVKVQIKQKQYSSLEELMDQIYSLMRYQIGVQKYKGTPDANYFGYEPRTSELFMQIYEFWSQNYKQIYSLYIVQEKLQSLKQYLVDFKKLDLTAQSKKAEIICKRLFWDVYDIFSSSTSEVKFFINFQFDQILLRSIESQISGDSKEITSYSFRSKQLIQAGNLNKQIRRQIGDQDKVTGCIFSGLYQHAKKEKLDAFVKVLENGQTYDEDYDPDFYKYKTYIKKSIETKITQEKIDKRSKYELNQVLGQGSFGMVFDTLVSDEPNQPNLALKQIVNATLKDLSDMIIESQLNLFFQNEEIPLMTIKDIFLFSNKSSFLLNLVMTKAVCELRENIIEKNKGRGFMDLYPIFKDLLIGITYMHSHFMTHGDIKPANMLIKAGIYYQCDYGTGRNLYYEQRADISDFFQVGFWAVTGTPNYMAPIMKSEYNKGKYNKAYKLEKVWIDLFKNDIYQAGVTLYEIATGKSIINKTGQCINDPNYNQQICYAEIYKLNIPIQMKNIMFQMIQYNESSRINVYSLHSSLMHLSERVIHATKFTILQQLEENQKSFYNDQLHFDNDCHNWFFDQIYFKADPLFKKITNQAKQDKSFLPGQQKLDYYSAYSKDRKQDKYLKGQILLILTNFILCSFLTRTSNDESKVLFNNQCITVKTKELFTVKFQKYDNIQYVDFYDATDDIWVPSKIISSTKDSYKIYLKESNQAIVLPVKSIKIRKCMCLKCVLCKQESLQYECKTIETVEKQLLAYSTQFTTANQLFNEFDVLRKSKTPLAVYKDSADDLKRNTLFSGTQTIYCYKEEARLNKLLSQDLINMPKMFYGIEIALNEKCLKTFQSGALKMLKLSDCKVSPELLIRLFNIFSQTQLQRLHLLEQNSLTFDESPTSDFLNKLKTAFKTFANTQQELYYLNIYLIFKGKDLSSVMNQFEDVSILINKHGHRFISRAFDFNIILGKYYENEMKAFAEKIRNSLNEYYNEWTCKYDDYEDYEKLHINNE